jgi:hypothetical protein
MAINFLNTVAVDENVLFVDTTNDRVGIGTTSPGGKLDIAYTGTGGTGTYGIGEGLNISSFTPNITFNDNSSNVSNYAIHLNQNVFTIGRYTSSTFQSPDLVLAQGRVGIGTTSPTAAKLVVSGNIKMTETAAATDTDKFVVLDSGVLKYRTGAQVISDLPTDSRYVAVVGDTMTGALTVNAKFTANDVDKHAPSVVYDADAGQVLKNEDSELAIGLGSVYPTSVNYPLWLQGRKNDDTARNICLQPVGGSVQIGVDNFNADKGSLATGYENEINGAFSFATGKTNVLGTSEATAAIGRLNEVTGLGSTAIGNENTVTSKNTVVIGRDNTANNEDNFILGLANTTQKKQSTAVGRTNNLNSGKIVAVGHANTSSGTTDNATSFGFQNNSQHSNSHLFGVNLQSSQSKEVIIGKNNDTPSNPTGATPRGANVIIGVGTGQYAGANMNAVEYYGFNDGSMHVIHKALYNASSYANDTDAAAGGVPIGGLYRHNNNVKIRLT